MKMTDFPCLYRLSETEHSIQCDFFCGLSSIFGMNTQEIIEHSVLFTHASQKLLFEGRGFTAEDIDKFGKKRLERPFCECTTLSSAFSDYDLKNEACRICKLSSNFKNQWIDDERILLSFLLQKGADYEDLLWDLQEKYFCSVCYLAPGKSLRTYPLITFNQYLFTYLKKLPSLEGLNRDKLVNEFTPYLHDIIRKAQRKRKIIDATIPAPISISFNTVYDCVIREFSILYSYSIDMLNVSQLAKSKAYVRDGSNISYSPPTIKHGTIEDDVPSVNSSLDTISDVTEKKRSMYQNSRSAGALFQMDIFDMLNVEIRESSPASISVSDVNNLDASETNTLFNSKIEFPPDILRNNIMIAYHTPTKPVSTEAIVCKSLSASEQTESKNIVTNATYTYVSHNEFQNTDEQLQMITDDRCNHNDANDISETEKDFFLIKDEPEIVAQSSVLCNDYILPNDSVSDMMCDTSTFNSTVEDTEGDDSLKPSVVEEPMLELLYKETTTVTDIPTVDNLQKHKGSDTSTPTNPEGIEKTTDEQISRAIISNFCSSCMYFTKSNTHHTLDIHKPYIVYNKSHPNITLLYPNISNCTECFTSDRCGLLFPAYNVKAEFFSSIIDCSIEDMCHIHSFLSDSCASNVICIEAIRFHLRKGLLFYMPVSEKYYFFDIDFCFSNFLQPILSTATKIRYLSLHSLPVYFMLSKLGFKHIYIESLANLFACVNNIDYNLPFSKQFQLVLNANKREEQDFYEFAMPLYIQFFENLCFQAKEMPGYSATLARCRNMNYFNRALSTAYELSDIVLDLKHGVSGLNQYDYLLHYEKNKPVVSHGILYLVSFPHIDGNEEMCYSLYHTIISSVYSLPYKCISYARLLAISSSVVTFFCTEDGDEFFDVLVNCARKVYKDTFHKMPIIDTKRIVY